MEMIKRSLITIAGLLLVFLGISLALAFFSFDAKADYGPCNFHDKILENAATKYFEYPVVRAYKGDIPSFIEILVSEEGGWTILAIDSENNWACIIAVGDRWEKVETPAEGDDLKPKIEMDEEPPKEIAA